ncbi:IS607 family element RNA-guided endonuclease TnpB [Umezawaea endophytica]|uniref:IS607 family element RNA-guided endonuclease TnpB n=1 Tax=Umezawaea endophytica TaxID=1654476 RepID=A0A9X2ZZY7_9PSEU|nr:IS607 family element RNA-guided endonuclease TnpB [Umezawaea endophytica]MCS7476428.1 IS607 family element RNA-guided endonuclease TnpB [Umezawaea endophytica]
MRSQDIPENPLVTGVIQAYRFALAPTPEQDDLLRSHCGAQRYAYNWGLALAKAVMDQRQAETTYGIPDTGLTPPLNWSAYSLRKLWNHSKDDVAPWWGENSKEAYSSGLANLATALTNWNASKHGARRGPKIRFPRFKDKRRSMSCRFTTGSFGLADSDRRHVKLPRIGVVRTHESTRKLARHVERGTARIRSATITHHGGRWFCSLSVEIHRTDPAPARPASAVGVDLGVKSLAVLSTGEIITNPRHFDLAVPRLRRLQRQAARRSDPDRRTRRQPSQRWHRTRARIAKLHNAVANARRDSLHKLTTHLVRTHGTVVVEDLNVAGMLKNRRLARHVAGVGMGEFCRQLDYKTAWTGGTLHVADRWYPSSKTCSACGAVRTKLRLAERTFHCDECPLVLDRDLNAARNLAHLVVGFADGTSSPSCGATRNEPAGNPRQTRTARAAGIATGSPGPHPGQRRHRKETAASSTGTHTRFR